MKAEQLEIFSNLSQCSSFSVRHQVPLTDLNPVNPVPAWSVATPTRKRDLNSDARGQRHRYFRKSRGSSGLKGAELLMPPPSSYGGLAPSALPPCFQLAGHLRPPPPLSHGVMTYDPYAPPRHHQPTTRAPRYRASSHSWRQPAAALNRECQFGFPAEMMDEPADLDAAIPYHQLDDTNGTVFPPLPTVSPEFEIFQCNQIPIQTIWLFKSPISLLLFYFNTKAPVRFL
ncbi:hypothetical protein PAMP_012806 [Pampus punctatissimus]